MSHGPKRKAVSKGKGFPPQGESVSGDVKAADLFRVIEGFDKQILSNGLSFKDFNRGSRSVINVLTDCSFRCSSHVPLRLVLEKGNLVSLIKPPPRQG